MTDGTTRTTIQYAVERQPSAHEFRLVIYHLLRRFLVHGFIQGTLYAVPERYYTLIRIETTESEELATARRRATVLEERRFQIEIIAKMDWANIVAKTHPALMMLGFSSFEVLPIQLQDFIYDYVENHYAHILRPLDYS